MQSVYIAGSSTGTNKTIPALGFMDILTSLAPKVGFFRPFAPRYEATDSLTELMIDRYQLDFPRELMVGCTVDVVRKMIGDGQHDALLKLINYKYRQLADHCDVVLVVGTDYEGLIPSLELNFNTALARHCGCLMVPVISGQDKTAREADSALRIAYELMRDEGGRILAAMVVDLAPDNIASLQHLLKETPLPEHPQVGLTQISPEMARLSFAEIQRALDAQLAWGEKHTLQQHAGPLLFAAMSIANLLDEIKDRSLAIIPADRQDAIMTCLTADASNAYPSLSGIVLTGLAGAKTLNPAMQKLFSGSRRSELPVLTVEDDALNVVLKLQQTAPRILPGDTRKIAIALGKFERVMDIALLKQELTSNQPPVMTPLRFEYDLLARAKSLPQRIVLPEGEEDRILQAAEILTLRQVAKITLLGDESVIRRRAQELGINLDQISIINPATSPLRTTYAERYHELRQHKGISYQMALDTVTDGSYFGTMMVQQGDADGMVSGAVNTTQHTIRPAFEIIKTKPGASLVSSVFLMCMPDQVLVFADCAVNPNPTAHNLAGIATISAETAKSFGIEPRVALLSYSSGNSGKGKDVDKVREALTIAQEVQPDLLIDGPLQYDAAVDQSVAKTKMPNSPVAGRATVLIFPDLNTGNNTYKAVQRSSGAVAIGPVLQGLKKPVNDLSRGCTITDIVNTVAITAIQAQQEILF